MPPKRVSKRQASRTSAPADAAKQRRIEPKSTSPSPTTSQFNPSELSDAIAKAISGALQSAGIVNASRFQPGASSTPSSTPQVVEKATRTEIEDLTKSVSDGRLKLSTADSPDELFSSVTFDLESRVSDRLKAKIWANEYIDFGSLLTVSPEETKYRLSVANDNDNPSLCFEHVKPKRKSLTIDQWLTAFNVFVAVYTVKAPHSISCLMKYCEVVRDIAAKQGNWRYYDEQFRFLRQSKPDRYPWDTVAWELWHQALHSSLVVSRQHNNHDFRARRPNQRPFQSFPKGVCWRFHSGQFCRGCNFRHSCFKCGGHHPAIQWNATRSNNTNEATPTPSSGNGGQGRASIESRANPGKARHTRVLPSGLQ